MESGSEIPFNWHKCYREQKSNEMKWTRRSMRCELQSAELCAVHVYYIIT